MMSLTTNLLKRILQLPADALISSSKKLRRQRLSPTFYPYMADEDGFILLESSEQNRDRDRIFGLPIPPQDLWEGYGITTDHFLNSGKIDTDRMKEIIHASNFHIRDQNRILDLGCAAGRMIRWLHDHADRCEI